MMTLMDLPPHYSGIGRLFPVRNTVLFPAVLQSVQVSQPKGIRLIEHALAGDRLVVIATQWAGRPLGPTGTQGSGLQGCGNSGTGQSANLGSVWGGEATGGLGGGRRKPESLYRMVCLARIVEHESNSRGYGLSILGIRRAWIRREVPTQNPFRMVDLQILEPDPDDLLLPLEVEQRVDLTPAQRDAIFQRLQLVEHWKRQLHRVLRLGLPHLLTTALSMQQLLDQRKSLESLTDLVSHLMRLPISLKLKQLQTLDPVVRAQRLFALLGHLHHRVGTAGFYLPSRGQSPSAVTVFISPQLPSQASGEEIEIDYQSAEFELAVSVMENEAEQGATEPKGLLAGEPLTELDQTMQEFPHALPCEPSAAEQAAIDNLDSIKSLESEPDGVPTDTERADAELVDRPPEESSGSREKRDKEDEAGGGEGPEVE